MKTKRKKEQPEIVGDVDGEPKVEESSKVSERISVPVNEDGTFDLSRVRETTKEKLRAAILSTPGMFPESSPVAAAAVPSAFPPVVVAQLYGAIGMLESMLAQRMAGIPKAVADQVFTYTPTELELLTPPTSRLLQKYASDWMIRYQDEITLGTLLVTLTINKVNAALTIARVHRRENVVPIVKDETPEEEVVQ